MCGTKYAKSDPREKRIILKEFLKENIANCRAIILEENFIFGRTNMQYLAYDDVFLQGLAQVEQLASLFASKIIIIHETISTAAELGMFAINPALSPKICVLVPDDISIEERKTSAFIKLAFLNYNSKSTKIGKQVVYYPDIEVNRLSNEKSDYHTYFHNNEIGVKLGEQIILFVKPKKFKKQLKIMKSNFGKPTIDPNVVDYYIDDASRTINAFVHVDTLKIQLLSLFFIEENRKEFRQTKAIKDHVSFMCEKYEEILLNTIAENEGLEVHRYSIKAALKGTEVCKLRQAVGYYLYMLQAIGLIGLEQNQELNASHRKIRISTNLDDCKTELNGLIYSKRTTEFGMLKI